MKRPAIAGRRSLDHVLRMAAARLFGLIVVLASALPSGGNALELPETMIPPSQKPAPQEPSGKAEPATELPASEEACRRNLRELGVVFAESEPIDGPQGCAAPHPLTVSQLPGGVALRPEAVLTCVMAEATARFVRDHAAPLARREFGSKLATIEQASSFVCRPRRGTQKLSEHAFANALDWSALELEDGTRIEVRAYDKEKEPRAMRLRAALDAFDFGLRPSGYMRTPPGPRPVASPLSSSQTTNQPSEFDPTSRPRR